MVECNFGMSLTFYRKKQFMRQSESTNWQNWATIFQSWSCPPICQNRVGIDVSQNNTISALKRIKQQSKAIPQTTHLWTCSFVFLNIFSHSSYLYQLIHNSDNKVNSALYQDVIALYNMEQHHSFNNVTDTRSENEKKLTNQLTHALTTLNLQRVNSKPNQQQNSTKTTRNDYLYVCITGLPNLPTQFEGIGIPGEKMIVYPQCFQPQVSQEQAKERLQLATLQKQAESLHNKLKHRNDKLIVFVIHSFGTSIMATFFRLYYNDYLHRVIGIIAIGCYPITPDQGFSSFLNFTETCTRDYLLKNVDQLYEKHKQAHQGLNLPVIKNKYANLAYLTAFGQGLAFSDFFSSFNRRWYPLLKCFIHGRQDNRISQAVLNEIAIFYAHKRKLGGQYQKSIRKVLKDSYGLEVDYVQERFIYNLDGGKHSVHLQKRFKPVISDIINEYLSVIQQITK